MRIIFFLILLGAHPAFSIQQQRYVDPFFDSVKVIKDVVYGVSKTQAGITQNLTMDIYMPAGDTVSKRPVILLAHGGYFLYGSKEDFAPECAELASCGYVAVSIDYRLLDIEESEISYKRAVVDAVFDMKAAVRYLRKDVSISNELNLDPENIFIGGYSAGAITSLHYAYVNTPEDIYSMGKNLLMRYVRRHGGIEGDSGNAGYSSSVRGVINIAGSLHHADLVDANEPILFSVHGTADDVVPYETGISGNSDVTTEGSGLIHKRAEEIKLTNQLITVPDADHGAFFMCDTCPLELRRFVANNLKR